MTTYEVFKGKDLEIAERIQQRRLQILVHSCLYYELNQSSIPDTTWDRWARELVELQAEYPSIAKEVIWAEAFNGFDGSTGFDLPIRDEWVINKARQLCKYVVHVKSEPKNEPKKTKRIKMKLF